MQGLSQAMDNARNTYENWLAQRKDKEEQLLQRQEDIMRQEKWQDKNFNFQQQQADKQQSNWEQKFAFEQEQAKLANSYRNAHFAWLKEKAKTDAAAQKEYQQMQKGKEITIGDYTEGEILNAARKSDLNIRKYFMDSNAAEYKVNLTKLAQALEKAGLLQKTATNQYNFDEP